MRPWLDVEVCELGPRHLQNGIRPPTFGEWATWVIEGRLFGELLEPFGCRIDVGEEAFDRRLHGRLGGVIGKSADAGDTQELL